MDNGSVRVYHVSGALCQFPISADPKVALADIQALLSAGFLAQEPEFVATESVNDIGYVLKRSRISDLDGSEVTILDCWINHEAMKNKFMTVYLDKPESLREFETLSGIALAKLPMWMMKKAPERGESPEGDKYIIRLPHPIGLVHKPNPRYDPNPDIPIADRKPKRLFVRWQALETQPHETEDPAEIEGVNSQLVLVNEIKFTKISGKNYLNLLGSEGEFIRLDTTQAFRDAGYDPQEWFNAGGTRFDPGLVVYVHPEGEIYKVDRIGEMPF